MNSNSFTQPTEFSRIDKYADKYSVLANKEQEMQAKIQKQQQRHSLAHQANQKITNEIGNLNNQMSLQSLNPNNFQNTNNLANSSSLPNLNQGMNSRLGLSGQNYNKGHKQTPKSSKFTSKENFNEYEKYQKTQSTALGGANVSGLEVNVRSPNRNTYGLDNPYNSESLKYKLEKQEENNNTPQVQDHDFSKNTNDMLRKQADLVNDIQGAMNKKEKTSEYNTKYNYIKELEGKYLNWERKAEVERETKRIAGDQHHINREKAIKDAIESKNRELYQKKVELIKKGAEKRIWFQNFSKNILQQQNVVEKMDQDGPDFSSKYNVGGINETQDKKKIYEIGNKIAKKKIQSIMEEEKFQAELKNQQNEAAEVTDPKKINQRKEDFLQKLQDDINDNLPNSSQPIVVINDDSSNDDKKSGSFSDDSDFEGTNTKNDKKVRFTKAPRKEEDTKPENQDFFGKMFDMNDPMGQMMMFSMMNGNSNMNPMSMMFGGGNGDPKSSKKESKKLKKIKNSMKHMEFMNSQQNMQLQNQLQQMMYAQSTNQFQNNNTNEMFQNTVPENYSKQPPIQKKREIERNAGESLPLPPKKAQSLAKPIVAVMETKIEPAQLHEKQNFNENSQIPRTLHIYKKPKTPEAPKLKIQSYKKIETKYNPFDYKADIQEDSEDTSYSDVEKSFTFENFSPNLRKWRVAVHMITWVKMLRASAVKSIQEKHKNMDEYYNNWIRIIINGFVEMIVSYVKPWIQKVANNPKLNVNFLKEKTSKKNQGIMINKIEDLLQDLFIILKRLFGDSTLETFPQKSFLGFCSNAFQEKCVPPDQYFTSFVYNRLSFSKSSFLQNQEPRRVKMILGVLLFQRIIVNKCMLRYWRILDVKKNLEVYENFYAIASCIYYPFVTTIYEVIPLVDPADNIAILNKKVSPKPEDFAANDNQNISYLKPLYPGQGEIIWGMPSKTQMKPLEEQRDIYIRLMRSMSEIDNYFYILVELHSRFDKAPQVVAKNQEQINILKILKSKGQLTEYCDEKIPEYEENIKEQQQYMPPSE